MVSIIIPNYNHAPYLNARIDSVLTQSYEEFELIVLDDSSTDDSRDIIEEYRNHPKISSIIYNETNSCSTFKQWNKGVEIAKGDIIWIAESDDVADRDFLEKLVPYFQANPDVGIVYCQSYKLSSDNEITGTWKSWTDDLDETSFNHNFTMEGTRYIDQFLLYKNTIPNASAVLFRKKVFQQIGGADPAVKYCSDWLTWLKMLCLSNIVYVANILNYFRYHEKSVIATASNNTEEIYTKKFGRLMRENFHRFFRSNDVIRINCKDIYYRNWELIIKEKEEEGLFELYRKNRVRGWSNIFNAAFSRGVKVKIILRALKKTLKGPI